MSDFPLLFLPRPSSASKTDRKPFPPSKPRRPDLQRQSERLSPILQSLQEAYERRALELQANMDGIDPEQVLVLETIGSIQAFVKAVRKIKGLSWLGEIEVDDIPSDQDFFDESDKCFLFGGVIRQILI